MKMKVIAGYAVLFVLLFALRIAYGYSSYPDGVEQLNFANEQNDWSATRNYASSKFDKGGAAPAAQGSSAIDQKYEKIANVSSKTAQFDKDAGQAKRLIQDNSGVIQFERRTGNPGQRDLNLVIGIHPDRFDTFYEQIQKIGAVVSRNVSKTDKTNEYLKLNATRISLEKSRSALIELKNKGGSIDEFIKLQERILDIENQLQNLGVSLGSFDEVNQFCTVKFSLNEGNMQAISIVKRVMVALSWTVKYYLAFLLITFFVIMSSAIIVWLYDRLNGAALMKRIIPKSKVKAKGKTKRK